VLSNWEPIRGTFSMFMIKLPCFGGGFSTLQLIVMVRLCNLSLMGPNDSVHLSSDLRMVLFLMLYSLDKGVELDCQWIEFDDVRFNVQVMALSWCSLFV